MAFGGKNSRQAMADSIAEEVAIDGDSIQAAIEQALGVSASATTGQGAKAAEDTLADTKQTVDSMRQRSLGARKEENKQMDADNEKRVADVGKSWMTLLMGDEEANASQGPDPLGLAKPDRKAIAKAKNIKDKGAVGLMGRPKLRPPSLTVDTESSINVRNNNLGNIKNSSKNKWKGQTNLDTEETFASFSSPELGVRALKKVIEANIKATSTIEEYVNRYASEPDERAHFKKTGSLLPHLRNYALVIAKSQGLDSEKDTLPKETNMLEWIKATARAEGGEEALNYFTDDIIKAGIK